MKLIAKAIYVRRFRIEVSRPNAWDVNRDFVETTQRAVEYLEGDQGRADVSGESLNRERLQDITRSAASTGTDAEAWLRLPGEQRARRRELSGNPVVMSVDDIQEEADWLPVMQQVRAFYRKLRQG